MRKLLLALAILCGASPAWAQATHVDNAAWGFATERMGPIGCVVDETGPRTGSENAAIIVRCTPLGATHVNLRNNAGTEVGTAAAPLRTDPTGTTTQPVSGTVTANAGSGPWPVTDNAGSLTVDTPQLAGTLGQKTMANSAAVVVASDQSAIPITDNAGSLTVDAPVGTPVFVRLSDGSAALTTTAGRLAVDPSGVTSPVSIAAALTVQQATASSLNAEVQGDAASGAAKSGNPVQTGAVFNTTQPTVTTGQVVEAQATARGALIVAKGVDGFALDANQSVNLAQVAGSATATGSGTATGAIRVELPTNGTGVVGLNTGANTIGSIASVTTSVTPGTAAGNLGKAEDAAAASADTIVPTAAVRRDSPTNDVSAAGDYGTLQINATGALYDQPTAGATGGCTPSKTISAATTNATNVKGSAGQVYSIYVTNTNASPRYLKLYNKATAPTVGTDVPVHTMLIPGNTSGAGGVLSSAVGMAFNSGIGFALTTGVADADTAAVAANEIVVNLCTL